MSIREVMPAAFLCTGKTGRGVASTRKGLFMASNPELQQIVALLKQGDDQQALAALHTYLKAHPDQAEAWYLLSFALADPEQQKVALQRALRLKPAWHTAQERLARLQKPAPSRRRSRWLLGGITLLVILVLAGAVLLTQRRGSNDDNMVLPTLASFPDQVGVVATSIPESSPTAVSVSPTTSSATAPDMVAAVSETPSEVTPSVTPSVTVTAAMSATLAATDTPLPPTLTPTHRASETPTEMPSPTLTFTITPPLLVFDPTLTPLPTAAPTLTPLPTVAPTLTPIPTVAPTVITEAAPTQVLLTALPPVTETPISSPTSDANTVPVNVFMDVGNGQLTVISAVRSASSAIKDTGGSVPAPTAGYEWVLVELLARCGDASCTIASMPLRIIGSSGQTYEPSPAFQSDVKFGAGTMLDQQVWGYQVFLVAQSEETIWLEVTHQGTVYRFALQ
jgi:hypothetical protein